MKWKLLIPIIMTILLPILCFAAVKDLYIPGTQIAVIMQTVEHTHYQDNNVIKVSIGYQDRADSTVAHLDTLWINVDKATVLQKEQTKRKTMDNGQVKTIQFLSLDPDVECNWSDFDMNDQDNITVKLLNTLHDNGL